MIPGRNFSNFATVCGVCGLVLLFFFATQAVSACGTIGRNGQGNPSPNQQKASPNQQKATPPTTELTTEARVAPFEIQVEELRKLLRIPGMSAVIVKDQKVLWAKGFGFADQEKQIAATPDTLYHIASLTKTFAATLIMQLVEQGKLDLNEPMSHYSTDFKDDSVRIKHLLSHTSEGTPGDRYQYSGNRYDYLTKVIEKKYGQSFRNLIVRRFLDPLDMSESVPSHNVVDYSDDWTDPLGKDNLAHYRSNLKKLAVPYTLYGDEIVRAHYPPKNLGAAAGLLSTVVDMAKYDAAIDQHALIKAETQAIAWTPFVSNAGKPLPHGLGWFAEPYHGLKLIWHYGHWGTGFSATYLKVPEKNLSLILLANTEALSDPFYQNGGIETNVFACTFLRMFVFAGTGNDYGCDRVSRDAVQNWLKYRREHARRAIKLDPKLFDSYVGRYQLNEQRTFVVTREGDRLFIDIPRGNVSEMFAEAEGKFFLKNFDARIRFVKDGIEIEGNGVNWKATKVK
jgi:CubicO group peptidase (beta-lactamase class C family)